MTNPFLQDMAKAGNDDWSYPFAFGYLLHLNRSFLRGDITMERFTSQFALVDIPHSEWTEAASGDETAKMAWHFTRSHYFSIDR